MEQSSQSTCWLLAEDLGHLKEQERSSYNWVGWKKEGKRKRRRIRMGPAPLVGSWRWGEVPASGEDFSLVGRSAGTEGRASGVWRRAQQPVCGKQDRVRPTQWSTPQPCTPQPEMRVCQCVWGWVLEHGVWRADPARKMLLVVRKQPEGMGLRGSANKNACGGSPDHHRSKAPLLNNVQRAGPPLQTLSSHSSPCLHRH